MEKKKKGKVIAEDTRKKKSSFNTYRDDRLENFCL